MGLRGREARGHPQYFGNVPKEGCIADRLAVKNGQHSKLVKSAAMGERRERTAFRSIRLSNCGSSSRIRMPSRAVKGRRRL